MPTFGQELAEILGQAFVCAEKREGGLECPRCMARGNPWVKGTGDERFFLGVLPGAGHQPYSPPQSARFGLELATVQ